MNTSASNNNNSIPKDGLQGLKENFTTDLMSGFLVSLLALPLSLGIAKASDFPAVFGLVAAIIGGLVVSFLAGSHLTIKGPAAGLIVIVSGCVTSFGGGEQGWHLALAAIVVAGVIQILFGYFRLGSLSELFPSAAIHGMLAAIGIIIMSKQIHNLLGIDPSHLKGKEPLELLSMIPESLMHENAHLTEIGIACLAIMIIFSFVKHQKIKKIPAPLVVLMVAVPLGFALHIKTEGEISNFALVKVGNIFDSFKGGLINADFSGITSNPGAFIQYVILFSLIGSIESLLTVKAIDKMDPYNRKSNSNKDLMAVGLGNIVSGLVGGLPMISEVARSSANVTNGAKTRWANFFHGLILLVAVLFATPFIEMIPNTALAAMLIFVGFRLAHPKEFMHVWHIGKDQFIVFVATVIVTLATDLLIGVGTGILLEIIVNLYHGTKFSDLFKGHVETHDNGDDIALHVQNNIVFSNIKSLKKSFEKVPQGKSLVIDVSKTKVIDHTSMVTLNEMVRQYVANGGKAQIVGLDSHHGVGHHDTSTKVKKHPRFVPNHH